MKTYDVIVIGTGAGNIIIEEAMKKGLKCAQIEKGKFGGTCLTRGCIPTKVMVSAADMIREIDEAKKIGIKTSKSEVDWNVLSERVWNKIDESNDLKNFYLKGENLEVYEGTAYFLEDKVIQVALNTGGKSEPITADKIFINAGGRTKVQKIEGLEETGYLTSETFFGEKYPRKPYENIIIMGGGPIGTEFAHVFSAFGTKVTLVQHNVRLLPKEEESISHVIKQYMEKFGVEVHLNQEPLSVRMENGKKILKMEERTTGEVKEVFADEILLASGIVPNSDLLHLENTSIQMDKRGWILTNEFLETSVEGVWALGDINGKQQFRHKANYEADILAHNLFMDKQPEEFRWANYELVPAVTFCYPQVAHIGLTEKEAEQRGYELSIGINHYYETAKGYGLGFEQKDELDAYAKLITDAKTGKMLGMHIVGPQASVLIQSYLNLMNAGLQTIHPINEEIGSAVTKDLRMKKLQRNLEPSKLSTVRETMVPHPTLSEVSVWTYYHMDKKEP